VLAHASGAGEDALVRGLDELWRRRIVGGLRAGAYDFTHDRIRGVAYGALGPALRRRNHLAVARALAALQPGDAARSPPTTTGPARPRTPSRGTSAQRTPPSDGARTPTPSASWSARSNWSAPARELELTTMLLPPVATAGGYGSPRLAELQQRGLDLCRELGIEAAPPLLRSLALAGFVAGDFDRRGVRRAAALPGRARRRRRPARGERHVLGVAAFGRPT
jgi:hypothetical protein